MNILLNYRGQLAIAAHIHCETIPCSPGDSIADVLRSAAARHGTEFSELILSNQGTFRNTLLIALDSEQIQNPNTTTLSENNREITLLPPIAGG